MTAHHMRLPVVAVLAALAFVGAEASAASPEPCGPGLPTLAEPAILNAETPLPYGAWADLTDGKGRGAYAVNYEGVGHGTMNVDRVSPIRHGDLDGDGDRDAVGIVVSHSLFEPGGGAGPAQRGAEFATLVVWRNDNGTPVPIAGRNTGQTPTDVELAVDRGLITFAYSSMEDSFDETSPPTRVNTRSLFRLRGSTLAEQPDPNRLDLGPFAEPRAAHAASLTVRSDGTWTMRTRDYRAEGMEFVITTGRFIARDGNRATVRVDGRSGTETWVYDPVNDSVRTGDNALLCGDRSPLAWCGA